MEVLHESIEVAGLRQPAQIEIDEWGLAHISASGTGDVFFAQGFNAARDRLWQIDLWRKRGLGRLAADFGPGYLEQDRASRLFLYRGPLAAEWQAYDGDAEATCIAFVAGINAYIDLIQAKPDRLPLEFVRMGTTPEKWQAEDVVRIRSHALSRNALSEVARANVMARSANGLDTLRQALDPPANPRPVSGIDLNTIPLEILDLFKLAGATVSFETARLAATLQEAPQWIKLSAAGEVDREGHGQGSNNWAIHGTRTATGRPILANDPHRAVANPSLRYMVHLSCPDFDVIGAGEPVLPGITIGHNGRIAFGLTIFTGPDQEDVYVYRIDPNRPDFYEFEGEWEQMKLVTESVSVKGYPDQLMALRFTRHGPVIFQNLAEHRAFAIRSMWFEPGSSPYFPSIAAMSARDFPEFRDRMKRWAVPSVNQVYADIEGNVGWIPAARYPLRPTWDGLLPVAGDGRFEWSGFETSEHLPHSLNPSAGFLATANEMNLPKDRFGTSSIVGYEWIEPSRALRIRHQLASDSAATIDASCRLQTDVVSLPAQRLCRILQQLPSIGGPSQALEMLLGWNGELSAGSAAAALFEIWWSRHLRPSVIGRLTEDITARLVVAQGDITSILSILEKPDARLGEEPYTVRDNILSTSLADAFADCSRLMGDDVRRWAWGDIHQVHYRHSLSGIVSGEGPPLNVGPLPQGGSSSTPMQTSYLPAHLQVTVNASVRIVLDVGDWDNSLWINSPGQSGDPFSSHYCDLAPLWAAGEYAPLLYSREAVATRIMTRVSLVPLG
jgi:penicillin G amidase